MPAPVESGPPGPPGRSPDQISSASGGISKLRVRWPPGLGIGRGREHPPSAANTVRAAQDSLLLRIEERLRPPGVCDGGHDALGKDEDLPGDFVSTQLFR